jgi:hypothetical protein
MSTLLQITILFPGYLPSKQQAHTTLNRIRVVIVRHGPALCGRRWTFEQQAAKMKVSGKSVSYSLTTAVQITERQAEVTGPSMRLQVTLRASKVALLEKERNNKHEVIRP